jgi:hypothetical protein
MPLFLDHHRTVEGLTAEAGADAHRKVRGNRLTSRVEHQVRPTRRPSVAASKHISASIGTYLKDTSTFINNA